MSEFSLTAINERILESSKFVKPLIENLEKAVVGQEELLNKIVICMLADGHMLLEGVPGLAKTLTVKTLASSINSKFQRIQFTPKLSTSKLLLLAIGSLRYDTGQTGNAGYAQVRIIDATNSNTEVAIPTFVGA